jgi:hypothetical protein
MGVVVSPKPANMAVLGRVLVFSRADLCRLCLACKSDGHQFYLFVSSVGNGPFLRILGGILCLGLGSRLPRLFLYAAGLPV